MCYVFTTYGKNIIITFVICSSLRHITHFVIINLFIQCSYFFDGATITLYFGTFENAKCLNAPLLSSIMKYCITASP